MKIPNKDEAEMFLREAEYINPGPWVSHSRYTAQAAEVIAQMHPELDSNTAYVMGLLHDIGRREGIRRLHHVIAGYKFLSELGYGDCAKICLTHCFLIRDINEYLMDFDCTSEEIEFIQYYISTVKYSDYDHLIQLCDFLAGTNGYLLLEKRVIQEALVKGVNNLSVPKWKRLFEIKNDFEKKMNLSIYELLPGVVENIFYVE